MQNITRLETEVFTGGTVTREGIVKRVRVNNGTGADWYVLTLEYTNCKPAITARREDASTGYTITEADAPRWVKHLRAVGA